MTDSPMITAARPIIMVPMPIPISAKPWYCATRPPDTPVSPFAAAMAYTFIRSTSTPAAAPITGLLPVHLMEMPASVLKKSDTAIQKRRMTGVRTARVQISRGTPGFVFSRKVTNVVCASRGTLARPITCRLMEKSPVRTSIPARRPFILRRVCMRPVAAPAADPGNECHGERKKGVPAHCDKHRRCGRSEREAAVHGDIGKFIDPESDEDPHRSQCIENPEIQRSYPESHVSILLFL